MTVELVEGRVQEPVGDIMVVPELVKVSLPVLVQLEEEEEEEAAEEE